MVVVVVVQVTSGMQEPDTHETSSDETASCREYEAGELLSCPYQAVIEESEYAETEMPEIPWEDYSCFQSPSDTEPDVETVECQPM